MTGIIVAGHGNFASGITSTIKLVIGIPENYEFIDFLEGESQKALLENLQGKVKALEGCEKIAIMTDIAGGSPFKTAVLLAAADGKLDVIAGTNVPMLMDLVFSRLYKDIGEELILGVMEAGRQQIVRYQKDVKGIVGS